LSSRESAHDLSVAVITRTKNRTLLLRRAIESVLGQSHADWQHVIVNDGGDALDVDKLVSEYSERYKGRLKVVHNSESVGMEAASNIGITASSSEYVVIHDDDDSWNPAFLQETLATLEACPIPSVRGVVTHINQVFEKIDGDKVIHEREQIFDPDLSAITLPFISEVNRFLPIAFIFKRNVFDEIGLYDESLPVIGDWEFNIRYFSKFDVLVLRKPLANYHVRTQAMSAYENTVTAGQDQHQFYRSLIINKHIRNDLESGASSLGHLLMYGDYFFRTSGGVWRINNLLDRLKNLALVRWCRNVLKK